MLRAELPVHKKSTLKTLFCMKNLDIKNNVKVIFVFQMSYHRILFSFVSQDSVQDARHNIPQ
jgi:hypothetical protein